MKSLVEFLNESKYRYAVMYKKKDGDWERKSMNDLRDFEPDSNMVYYEVINTTNPDLTDIAALIEWHGEGGYWDNVLKNSMNPDKAPEDARILDRYDLELLKKKKK